MCVPVMRARCERARAMLRAVCVLALVAAVVADAEKREEMSPMPFVLGSRYGRSGPRLMAARNDRFFFGSRYGKRSAPPAPRTLVCERARGLAAAKDLYRCSVAPGALARFYQYFRKSDQNRTQRNEI